MKPALPPHVAMTSVLCCLWHSCLLDESLFSCADCQEPLAGQVSGGSFTVALCFTAEDALVRKSRTPATAIIEPLPTTKTSLQCWEGTELSSMLLFSSATVSNT